MSESTLNANLFRSSTRGEDHEVDPIREAVNRLQGDEGVRAVIDPDQRYEDDWDPWG